MGVPFAFHSGGKYIPYPDYQANVGIDDMNVKIPSEYSIAYVEIVIIYVKQMMQRVRPYNELGDCRHQVKNMPVYLLLFFRRYERAAYYQHTRRNERNACISKVFKENYYPIGSAEINAVFLCQNAEKPEE